MKHQFIHILFCISLVPALLLSAACSREGQPEAGGAESLLVSQARMDLSIDRWDTATKAEGTDAWPDWARIFVQLSNGRQYLPLEVYYANGTWSVERVELTGENSWSTSVPDLTGFSGGYCRCYYFEREEDNGFRGDYFNRNGDGTISVPNAETAVYHDADAIFSIVDGVLEFKAHLEPLTGRIRFVRPVSDPRGDDWYNPGVYGMRRYTVLDRTTFEMQTSATYFTTSINSGKESSRYVYGVFDDPDRRTLTVVDGKWNPTAAYERSFREDILAPGSSNQTYMPIEQSHNEWYRYDGNIEGWSINLGNTNLNGMSMYYVVPGTFQMGGEDARPVHNVTLTRGFYLSETEITKDMWYRVMGEPSDYANAAVPVTGKTWEEVQAFIAVLNAKSGYSFRLPTEAEWEFAARGGMKSHGYKYSGGDDYADVAVHDGNWSMQAVKTKNTNELGFYDMSGNASEWVNDWYAAYPTGTVVDPKGPDSGEVHVRRGGNRGQDLRYLTVTYRDLDSDLSLTGFRLAMDAPKIQ